MTQAGELNAFYLAFCDAKFGLVLLQVLDHEASQVGNSYR
jgi:hypothetical protein